MRRYPGTAYRGGQRAGSAAAAGGLSLPGTAPAPQVPGKSPGSYNKYQGPRLPANDMLARGGGRALFGRFIPWLGWGLVAWELYDWWSVEGERWSLHQMRYSLTIDCPRIANSGWRNGTFSGCAGILAMGSVVSPLFPPYPAFLHRFRVSTATTGRPAQQWTRLSTDRRPYWIPPIRPGEDPYVEPSLPINPAIDPMSPPIGVPMPAPAPAPWRAIPDLPHVNPRDRYWREGNPWRSPTEQPRKGYEPTPNRPDGQPAPVPNPVPGPSPVPGPVPGPAPVPPPIVISPVPGPRGAPLPRTASPSPPKWPQPPGPRTRERKAKTSQGVAIVNAALNLVTEGVDLVDAIWWALPPQYRSGPTQLPNGAWVSASPQRKGVDIYRNYDKIDIEAALRNILMEELADRIGGAIGRAQKKSVREAWRHGYSNDPHFTLGRGPAM